ncbi:uncharacterized protein LOC112554681 [Pomacea canaliculata]|nr:uncharacterized protein LOC112554681 [Pomacea canaliculata]
MTGGTQVYLLVLALCGCGRLVWGHTGFHQEGSTFQKREPPLSISNFSHPCMDTWKCVSDKLGLKQLMSTGGISLASISASEVIDPLCSERLPAARKCLETSTNPNCTSKSSFLDIYRAFCKVKEGLKAGHTCWNATDVGQRNETCMATFLAAPKTSDRCGSLPTLQTCLVTKLQATSACTKEDVEVVKSLVADSISHVCNKSK